MSLFDNALESALARAMDPDARAKSAIATTLADSVSETVREKRIDNAERAGQLITKYGEESIVGRLLAGIVSEGVSTLTK